jgi:hypothetical protein
VSQEDVTTASGDQGVADERWEDKVSVSGCRLHLATWTSFWAGKHRRGRQRFKHVMHSNPAINPASSRGRTENSHL